MLYSSHYKDEVPVKTDGNDQGKSGTNDPILRYAVSIYVTTDFIIYVHR